MNKRGVRTPLKGKMLYFLACDTPLLAENQRLEIGVHTIHEELR